MFLFRQTQQRIGIFHHWSVQIALDCSCHRPSGQNDRRLFFQAPCGFQQAVQRRSNWDPQISWPRHGPAAHRHSPVRKRLSLQQSTPQGIGSRYIEHGTLDIRRGLPRRDLPPSHRPHQLLLHAQGVARLNGQ